MKTRGGNNVSRRARTNNGELCSQWGPEAKPLVRGLRGRSPLKLFQATFWNFPSLTLKPSSQALHCWPSVAFISRLSRHELITLSQHTTISLRYIHNTKVKIPLMIEIVKISIQVGVVEYMIHWNSRAPRASSDWKRNDFKIVTFSICVMNVVEYGSLK